MALNRALKQQRDRTTSYGGWVIVLIGLLSTYLVAQEVSKKNRHQDQMRIDYETDRLTRRVRSRIDRYVSTLIEFRAFLLSFPELDLKLLSQFTKDTELFSRLPGLQGIGLCLFVPPEKLARHEKEMQKFYPGYKIWPASPRTVYSSIVFLWPQDWRNKRAVGFDMYTERERRRAMDEAIDTEKAVLTAKIKLVQEKASDISPGFNLYLPYYKKGADLSTIEGRRKAILGFVYSPFRSHQLFNAIFSEYPLMMDVQIYDGVPNAKNLIYDSHGLVAPGPSSVIRTVSIDSRTFTLIFTPLSHFLPDGHHYQIFWILSIGSISTLLILSIWLLTRRQMKIARILADENERMLKKEKEHVAARDEFLSIASHELKTPLTSLKLQAQVMMRSMNKNEQEALSRDKVLTLVKQIDTQTTRLTRLVDDMLDLSRIRTGKLRIEKERVPLAEMVHDVIERLRPQFLERIGMAPELQIVNNPVGDWDKFRIEQVITNLLTNALKYGNGKPVEVIVKDDNKEAKVIVRDHGIGIASENLSRIFERFERAGISSSEVSGLGLGLFITRQIVRSHGGRIDVESEMGKGSTFTVVLPLEKQEYYTEK